LDSVKPLIHERLAAYPALSAVRLYAECQAAGYTGRYSLLTAYLQTVRRRARSRRLSCGLKQRLVSKRNLILRK